VLIKQIWAFHKIENKCPIKVLEYAVSRIRSLWKIDGRWVPCVYEIWEKSLSKKALPQRELVLMLCLPSVDALWELCAKGISPVVVSQVSMLWELRPKGICPNVVSLVQIPRVSLLSPLCIEVIDGFIPRELFLLLSPKCRCSKRASSQGNQSWSCVSQVSML